MNEILTLTSLAKMIDHALLHPALTDETIARGCVMARSHEVASACVKPYAVPLAHSILLGSDVCVCAVVAFPHGNATMPMKVKEAEEAAGSGATELSVVVNIGKVLSGDWNYVSREICALNEVVVSHHALLKVIIETIYLEDRHIIRLCEICATHNVGFIATATGFGTVHRASGPATHQALSDHHLHLIRQHCPPGVRIVAAGGMRCLSDLLRARKLGASRITTTATESILEEAVRQGYA